VARPGDADLTGRLFGRLRVVGPGPLSPHGKRTWVCRCGCGSDCRKPIPTGQLTSGRTTSCGCARAEAAGKMNPLAAFAATAAERPCRRCGASFRPATPWQRCCTPACQLASRDRSAEKPRRTPPRDLVCRMCGRMFTRQGRSVGCGRYCSDDCRQIVKTASVYARAAGPPEKQLAQLQDTLTRRLTRDHARPGPAG
jgi:hypothetical protein